MSRFAPGRAVRSLLGSREAAFAEAFRGWFFDLDALGAWLAARAEPKRILEVGCGEGAVATRLAKVFPRAEYLGIDLSDRAGRLYAGPPGWARFLSEDLFSVLARDGGFDLVVVCDVLHHVPPAERGRFLAGCLQAARPGGRLLLKDWARDLSVPHFLGWFADRVVAREAVRYGTVDELRALLGAVLPEAVLEDEAVFPPRRNNVAFLLRR